MNPRWVHCTFLEFDKYKLTFNLRFNFLESYGSNIVRVLFFELVEVIFCTFMPCSILILTFFILICKLSIHFRPVFPYSHQGNSRKSDIFFHFQGAKKRNIGLECVSHLSRFTIVFSWFLFFFILERYDLNEISGFIALEQVNIPIPISKCVSR